MCVHVCVQVQALERTEAPLRLSVSALALCRLQSADFFNRFLSPRVQHNKWAQAKFSFWDYQSGPNWLTWIKDNSLFKAASGCCKLPLKYTLSLVAADRFLARRSPLASGQELWDHRDRKCWNRRGDEDKVTRLLSYMCVATYMHAAHCTGNAQHLCFAYWTCNTTNTIISSGGNIIFPGCQKRKARDNINTYK